MKKKLLLFVMILSLLCAQCLIASAADYDLLMGDIDNSGTLSAGDARLVLRASVGLEPLDEEAALVADIDFDGALSAGDARMILRASVGLEALSGFYHTHIMQPQVQQGSCVLPTIASEDCTICGYSVITNFIPAPDHDWTDFVRSEENHYRSCKVCLYAEEAACELVETINIPATCTTDGYIVHACVCGRSNMQTLKGGHSYSAWTKNAAGNYTSTCANCNDIKTGTPEMILHWFNGHVNRLKEDAPYEQRVAILHRTHVSNIPSSYSLSLLLIKDTLDEALYTDETTYSAPAENRQIANNNFPAMTHPYVSDLSMNDIKSLDIAFNQTVNVLSSMPTTFSVKKTLNGQEYESTYDISDYKNTAPVTDAIKITVKINDEKATRTGVSGTTNVYSYTSGGKAVNVTDESPLVMSRFYGLSLPDLCNSFPQFTANDAMSMMIDCASGNSAGTAEWFFDAQTLEPIACIYSVSFHIDQEVTLDSLLLSGELALDTNMEYEYIFLFGDYYPCMAE